MDIKRRIVFFAILVILAAYVHSEETKQNYFNFGAGGLIAISDGGVSPGFGLATAWINPNLFSNRIGIGTYINILVPLVEDPVGATNFGGVFSILAGPSIVAIERNAFSIPITLGYHFNYVIELSSGGDMIPWAINMGLGLAVDAVYQFGDKWHFYGRVISIYNFGADGEFLLLPGIGLGFRF